MPFRAYLVRCSVQAFSVGVRAGLARSPARRCEATMQSIKRGEPLPINGALNRPRTKLGLELSAWMSIVFVTVTVFLVGFKWLALFSFPALLLGAWLIVRKHPKMFQLWSLSLKQRSYYDPRK